jgi:Na+-driven multidrug efflux pump
MSLSFLRDKEFFRAMLAIAVPVAFQQLITAGLNVMDVLMVGQLGESAVAALGLANQIFFLLILFLFGVTSGMSIFSAQFWGTDPPRAWDLSTDRCVRCCTIYICGDIDP